MVTAAKTGRPSMNELAEMLRAIQEKEKTQEKLVKQFQRLVQRGGFAAANDFPYPMASYQQDGTLVYVNQCFSKETGISAADLSSGNHNILNRITDENLPLLDAVEQVFMAKKTSLSKLSDPMEIFISEKAKRKSISSPYQNALLFPLTKPDGKVSIGAVIFME